MYFSLFRDIRGVLHENLRGTILPENYGVINDEIAFITPSSVAFILYRFESNPENGWQYKMPFGSFFLFSLIGLVFIKAKRKSFLILISFHFIGGLLSTLFVWIGIHGFTNALIFTDFISRYLLPIGSLGLVALTLVQIKDSAENE